jgi:hypothetical protein
VRPSAQFLDEFLQCLALSPTGPKDRQGNGTPGIISRHGVDGSEGGQLGWHALGDEFLGPNVAIGLGAFAQSAKEQVQGVGWTVKGEALIGAVPGTSKPSYEAC